MDHQDAYTHINRIFTARGISDPNSTSLAQTIQKDIDTGFKGDHKFIYELLQNADDASVDGKPVYVEMSHLSLGQKNFLIFSHTGKHFSPDDVEKITDNAQQRFKDKTQDQEKTGYKGIGFKAIFTISDCVHILSKSYTFRFDKQFPKWQTGHEHQHSMYPWQIIPIWTNPKDLPQDLQRSINPEMVTFVMEMKPHLDTDMELKFVDDNQDILLFLRHIEGVQLQRLNHMPTMISFRKENEFKTLTRDDQDLSLWYMKQYVSTIPDDCKKELVKFSDYECPTRLKLIDKTTMTFAIRLTPQRKPTRLPNASLYCYLPTQIRTGLPFLVNADFLLDATRAHLLSNSWNIYLCESIGFLVFQLLAKLANVPQIRKQILTLLPPSKLLGVPVACTDAFLKGFHKGLDVAAFIPSPKPEITLKFDEALLDVTGFFLRFPAFQSPAGKTLIADDLENIDGLQHLQNAKNQTIAMMQLDDLIPLMGSHLKQMRNGFQDETQFFGYYLQVVQFFSKYEKSRVDMDSLSQMTLLYTHRNTFSAPQKTFLHSDVVDDLKSIEAFLNEETKINFIHPLFLSSCPQETFGFLRKLGLGELDQKDLVREIIIPFLDHSTDKTVVATKGIILVYFIWKRGVWPLLDRDVQLRIQKMQLLNVNDVLANPRRLYFADVFEPELKLQELMQSPEVFLSPRYCELEGSAYEKRKFFKEIFGFKEGVRIEIKDVTVEKAKEAWGDELITEYIKFLKQQGQAFKKENPSHILKDFLMISLIPFSSLYQIAEIIFSNFLRHWEQISTLKPMYTNDQSGLECMSFMQFFFRTHACIPTLNGRLYRSGEVFSREFREFGDILPVIGFDQEIGPEVVDYVGLRRTLTVDDVILGLQHLNKQHVTNPKFYNMLLSALVANHGGAQKLLHSDKKKISKMDILLVTQSRSLEVPKHLYYAKDKQKSSLQRHFVDLEIEDSTQEKIQEICDLFKIHVVGPNDLDYQIESPQLDTSVHQKIFTMIPILVRIETMGPGDAERERFEEVCQCFGQLQFYRAEKISFAYKFFPRDTTLLKAFSRDKQIFFVGSWSRNRNIDDFVQILSEYLGLGYDPWKIRQILTDDDPMDWLGENGIPTNDLMRVKTTPQMIVIDDEDEPIPDAEAMGGPKPLEQSFLDRYGGGEYGPQLEMEIEEEVPGMISIEDTPILKPLPNPLNNQTDVPSRPALHINNIPDLGETLLTAEEQSSTITFEKKNLFPPEIVSMAETRVHANGYLCEYLVYQKLMQKAREKYQNTCEMFETKTMLQVQGPGVNFTLSWHNGEVETGISCDLTKTKNNRTRYIEVKAMSPKGVIHLSGAQLHEMERLGEDYQLYVVTESGEGVKIIKFKNPMQHFRERTLKIRACEVYFGMPNQDTNEKAPN